MKISSINDDSIPLQERQPRIEYTAQVVSPFVSGKVILTISDTALTIAALFDVVEIPYARMNALFLADYIVTINSDEGVYAFSHLGHWTQPFYDELYESYNKAVLRSFFIRESPLLTTNGDYISRDCAAGAPPNTESYEMMSRNTPVQVYKNCVVVLPPDLNARRIPLCFVTELKKGDYSLTLRLDTGKSCIFSRLGYDTVPFADTVEKQIRSLHEKSLAVAREMDQGLSARQASLIAKLIPEGSAAPFSQLSAIAPSFASAIEDKLATTRAAEYYKEFKNLCDPMQMYIGFKKNITDEGSSDGKLSENVFESTDRVTNGNHLSEDSCLLWLIIPSPNGMYAAVEFAEADNATFVYRTNGGFNGFTKQLNHALESINFRREVIRLTNSELLKPEHADNFMAVSRVGALQFIRSNFIGRVIHSGGMELWKRKLTELWGDVSSASKQEFDKDEATS